MIVQLITYLLIILIIIGVGFYLFKKMDTVHHRTTHKDTSKTDEHDDDENDINQEPVFENGESFLEFQPISTMFDELGIIDIDNRMIEYESFYGGRRFVSLAEMKQTNPYIMSKDQVKLTNALREVALTTLVPGNETSFNTRSKKIDMRDFEEELRAQAKEYNQDDGILATKAEHLINDMHDHQTSDNRFEIRTYVSFETIVYDEEIDGDTDEEIDAKVKAEAFKRLRRQIDAANGPLSNSKQSLSMFTTVGLLEVMFDMWHRVNSSKVRLEDIIRNQNFSHIITADQSDAQTKLVQSLISKYANDSQE
ncbi:hypothetical protein C1940_17155 (plasmid) [Lactiplantibacillus plantarum subsp. plantarum]|uniref:hypothetical protein n=1 Tax=Lactiplantibacillus plantarum TaxID=1590 RepID=UPI000CD33E53|nr:hypothetical protein [Lactiplantibacillus plantarum]AUV74178.1 hypothetical protein C1940_17155 [Lactiplantibacillus plantarum subsp. plantarum]